ncbi:hypothetical protein C2U72_23915 [Prosthecomicrobium hirschii]|uniref:hypothetical protein n=1 Tax=Prosthecodimorpha hirschii TaxID=665126 RepID=UPI001129485A|nr:hypothetical protein [Prosthecomicrobium hirschii]TPQ47838.1 hypothetical protein C2U72_23915 [Prosthecomicrobium hirschii]
MQIIFHIGAPKTATTSLQHALKPARLRLAQQGIAYVPTGKLRNSEFGEALRDETPSFFRRRVSRKAVDDFVRTWSQPGTDRMLVSEEGFSIYLLHPRRKGGDWASQAGRTFKILRHFEPYDFRVVLTVRRQDSYLLSCYAHLVRHGRIGLPFEEWWPKEVDLSLMSWRRYIEALNAEYGAERVTVLPYERIRDGFGGYYRNFIAEACRVPEESVADMEPEENALNPALSDPAMQIALIVNRHTRKQVTALERKDLIKEMKRVLPPKKFPKYAPDINDLREATARIFTDENRYVNEHLLAAPHPGFLFD